MTSLMRAWRAEVLKTKRTLMLTLAFVAPLSVVFLEFIARMQHGDGLARSTAMNEWLSTAQNISILWGMLVLPLFVTLETGLLGSLEHSNKTWKELYALPIPRWAVYAAKQLMAMGLLGPSTVCLIVATLGNGLVLNALKPQLGFSATIPWRTFLMPFALTYLASWLIISLHLWISLRWPSFVVAMAAGIVATIANVMIVNSDWAVYYPWALPGTVSLEFLDGRMAAGALALGLLGGVAVALAGGWEVIRQDVL